MSSSVVLARATRRSVAALGLAPGTPCHAVIKSVAIMVELPGGSGRTQGTTEEVAPIAGSPQAIAEQLRAFSGLVDHLQLVVDPITAGSIEALAPVVDAVHAD